MLAEHTESVADPDFELRWGPGFGLLALPDPPLGI